MKYKKFKKIRPADRFALINQSSRPAPATGDIQLSSLEQRLLYTGVTQQPTVGLPEPDVDFPAAFDQVATQSTLDAQVAAAGGALIPVSGGVPVYHSNPSATAKLIVDFDGATAYTWGSYNVPATPAYDQDGDPTTFNTAELTSINEILARVSEKYSPFDIDVTTVDSGTYTNRVSTKVIVGGAGAWLGAVTGGIAFIGGFYNVADNIAYVFPTNLANGFAKYVGEAVSHEAGHTFGLQHQGTFNGSTLTAEYNAGDGQAAPVMGVSYYAARGLWWTGTPSNNSAGTQADLALLGNASNGYGFRADDYGGTTGTASPLTMSGNAFTASGVIERNTDADYFSFTTASGTLTLNLGVAQYGAMLDGSLFVYSSSGTLVASADTANLGEALTLDVGAGTYYVSVASHGGYGDLGQYTLAGSLSPGVVTVSDPTNLTATPAGARRVTLSWADTSRNESGFSVERSDDGGTTWAVVAVTAANVTTVDDTTVAGGGSYWYRVQAFIAGASSGYTTAALASTAPDAPGTIAAVANSTTQNTVTWANVAGETGFLLDRSADGVTWSQLTTTGTNVSSYVDTGLSAGTRYYYRVRASNASGNSNYSSTTNALTLPGIPTGVAGTAASTNQLTLTWAAVTGAASYQIDRSPDGSAWSALGTSLSASYTDTSLSAATHYYYRVRAVNASGNSGDSATADVLTLPASPTLLTAVATSTSQVTLTWLAVTGASTYAVERSPDGSTWGQIGTTGATSYGDAALSAGARYYYRVRAGNAAGYSGYSSSLNTFTFPAAPSGLTATAASATRVGLTWPAVVSATSYAVERSTDTTTWSSVGSTASTSLNDSAAVAGTSYTYRVRATNASGASSYATATALTFPATPGTIGVTVTATGATLTWAGVTGAATYAVERSSDGSTWAAIGTPATGTYADAGLSSGTHYFYRVKAANASGASGYSPTLDALTRPATPAAPTVTATSTTQVTVTWAAVASATSYAVDRSTDDATWAQVTTTASTSFADSGLSAGTRYYYRLRAVNASGNSGNATSGNAFTVPAAPAGVAAAGTTGQVTLTWGTVTGAASYSIERSADGTNWSALGTSATATYTDSGLTAATHYFYRVRAVNTSGNSAYSTTLDALTVPAAPAGATATPNSTTQVTVTWSAVTGATSYALERSTDNVTWTQVTTGAVTTYVDSAASAGTQYHYRVRASNGGGFSAYGTVANALTAPAAPSALNVATSSQTSVALSWTTVAGAATYRVERSVDGITWSLVTTTAATSVNDSGLAVGITYYFRVRADNATGSSAFTTATNVLTPPGAPSGLTVTNAATGLLGIGWAATSGATQYTVERSTDGIAWATVAVTGTGVTTLTETGLSAATHYFYRVTASNPSGASQRSATLDALTTPTAPGSLAAGSSNQVALTWPAVTGATSYAVERSADGTTWTQVTTTGTNSFTDTGVAAGGSYTYRVRAANAAGYSVYTAVASALTLPATPSIVSVLPQSTTRADLTWAPVTGASSYTIQRTSDGGSTWTTVGTTASTSLSDTALAAGTSYEYRVRAGNATGASAYSDEVNVLTAPECPAVLVANSSVPTAVVLSWLPVSGASGYEVERSLAGGDWQTLGTVADAGYVDQAVTPGTFYSYRVRALNSTGYSPYTSVASATTPEIPVVMADPSGLTVEGTSSTSATITWQDNSDNEEGFTIERSADDGQTWTTVAQTAADVSSYDDSTLAGGTSYVYRVQAFSGHWTSNYSESNGITTTPAAPTGVAVSTVSVNQLGLSWGGVHGATTYEVERSADGTTGWATIATVTGTTFVDSDLPAGTRQSYRVRAVDDSGASIYSAVTTNATLPAAPAFAVALANPNGTVGVSWSAVAGATGYLVERSADGAHWSQLTTTSGVMFTVDTGVAAGTTYQYRARALGQAGPSAYTEAAGVTTYPAAPTSPLALPLSDDQINVSWVPVTGADGYVVERSTDGVNWSEVGETDGASYTDHDLSPNRRYFYRATSFNAAGLSDTGGVVDATTLQAPPAAPSALSLVPVSSNTIQLTWQNRSENQSGFKVEYSVDGKTWKLAGNLPANSEKVQITGLLTGQNYKFRLSAYNEMGLSPTTNGISGKTLGSKPGTQSGSKVLDVKNVKTTLVGLSKALTPDAPTGLRAAAYSTTAVQLTWKANADNELGYRVEYSLNGKNWLLAGYTAAGQSGARVTNLVKGKAYSFRVTAYNLAGDSAKFATAKTTLPTKTPVGARPSSDSDQDTTLNVLKVKASAPGLTAALRAA